MIVSFADAGTDDLYNGADSKAARRVVPGELMRIAWRKLDQLDKVPTLDTLRIPPGNRLEGLKGDRKGQHSVRINDRYRVCFRWRDDGPADVEVVDYH